jgi:hypothetical protein
MRVVLDLSGQEAFWLFGFLLGKLFLPPGKSLLRGLARLGWLEPGVLFLLFRQLWG